MEEFESDISKFTLKVLGPKCRQLASGKNKWIRVILLRFTQIPYNTHMVRF